MYTSVSLLPYSSLPYLQRVAKPKIPNRAVLPLFQLLLDLIFWLTSILHPSQEVNFGGVTPVSTQDNVEMVHHAVEFADKLQKISELQTKFAGDNIVILEQRVLWIV